MTMSRGCNRRRNGKISKDIMDPLRISSHIEEKGGGSLREEGDSSKRRSLVGVNKHVRNG